MKSKLSFLLGLVMGLSVLCCTGAASAVVATLTAVPSTQTFYLDGEEVTLEAYAIEGCNYVKLRDIGKTVDFNVCYDPVHNSVIIESDQPYDGQDKVMEEELAAGETLANGMPITEENVLALLHEVEAAWPDETLWGKRTVPGTNWNQVPSTESAKVMSQYNVSSIYACGGYASMVSSLVFGDGTNPARKLEDVSQLRPGDIVLLVNDTGKVSHVVVALESPNSEGRFHTTDGNASSRIRWPEEGKMDLRTYSVDGSAKCHIEVWTRYPEGLAVTGSSVGAWT